MPYRNLTANEVKALRDRGEQMRLIDVREPQEHALAWIEGAELLPLSRHREWIETLPHEGELIFFCHSGVRSAQVAHFLSTQRGHTNVAHMVGGIDAWSESVDPDVPRY